MFQTRSIKFRLTLWYALALSAILAIFGGLLWFSLRNRLLNEVDEELRGRASRFESYFRVESANERSGHLLVELTEFCQALPPSHTISIHGSNGFVFRYPQTATSPVIGETRTTRVEFTLNSVKYELELGAPLGDVQHTLDLLRLLLLSLLPVVILLSCLAGAWLGGRALNPVNEITAAAQSISIENLSARLPSLNTNDELARLTGVLNGMFARLEDAVQTLSQFAGDASHELRTPLAVIRTTAELALRKSRDPESYRQSLQQVLDEADRMTALIEELLQLARNDDALNHAPTSPVDLVLMLQDICRDLQGVARERQIRLREPSVVSSSIVSGSEAGLRRLFLALIDNSLKYSAAGGEVRIEIEKRQGELVVDVRDFGEGIATSHLPHIFKRFYRGDQARTGEGHGLGLALAASIAQAHGARIEVESVEGSGSVFRVVFPVHAPSPLVSEWNSEPTARL